MLQKFWATEWDNLDRRQQQQVLDLAPKIDMFRDLPSGTKDLCLLENRRPIAAIVYHIRGRVLDIRAVTSSTSKNFFERHRKTPADFLILKVLRENKLKVHYLATGNETSSAGRKFRDRLIKDGIIRTTLSNILLGNGKYRVLYPKPANKHPSSGKIPNFLAIRRRR